jgi:hypothetical protein
MCTCHVTHVRHFVIGDTYRSVEVRVNVQLFAIAPGEDAIGREASGPKLRSGRRCIHAVPSAMVADTTTAAFVVAAVRVGSGGTLECVGSWSVHRIPIQSVSDAQRNR